MQFIVPDMTCGHCAGQITKAVASVDAAAEVQIDIDAHRVTVRSALGSDAIARAMTDAGYTPELQSA